MAGLMLACTGKPVLHAYAGPLGLLSFAFGATGVGVGHSQNLWKFTPDRWAASGSQGGGGDAPARFFSGSLWGTIIYPDETVQLSPSTRNEVLTLSPFSQPVASSLPWPRWDSGKHLVYILCERLSHLAQEKDPRKNAATAIAVLDKAIALHNEIQQESIFLGDKTAAYQANWKAALQDLLKDNQNDFDFFDLLD